MKALSLLIAFILLSFGKIEAQISDFPSYQSSIHTAELHVVSGNHLNALNIYYETLTKHKGNFAKDLYNALLLAKELHKIDTFFSLLDLVRQKNFSTTYINNLPEFSEMHPYPQWQQFINTNNQTIYIDTALKARINQLHNQDQSLRVLEDAYSLYGDTIRKIDSLNMSYLINLIQKSGLPGETTIGAQDFSGIQGYDIVLHHHSQSRSINKQLIDLIPLLKQQVIVGKIAPNKCAHYFEMQGDTFRAGVFAIFRVGYNGAYSPFLIPDYNTSQHLLIDSTRKEFLLESLEDYYKKAIYLIKNPNTPYLFDIRLNTLEAGSETDFISWQKKGLPLQ